MKPAHVLECTRGNHEPVRLRITTGEYVLGREPTTCQVVLPGKQVSRRHAVVRLHESNAITVQDLESFNGTLVRGARIKTVSVKMNEAFTVGEWTVKVRPGDAADERLPVARSGVINPFEAEPTAMREIPREAAAPVPARSQASVLPAYSPAAARTRSGVGAQQVKWSSDAPPNEDSVRERSVDSPLLRRITQHMPPLQTIASREAQELATLARNKNATQELALRLVYKVAAELQHARNEDEFLTAMADTLLQATRAETVALLLCGQDSKDLSSLDARVVRNADGANALRFSRSIVEQALGRGMAVASEDATADERFSRNASIVDLDVRAVLAVPMMRETLPVGVIYMTRRTPFSDAEEDLAAALGHLTALGIERARLKERVAEEEAIRRNLERFHTPEVVEKLMQKQAEMGTGLFLEPITATVLFCDLVGFTSFCDKHTASEVAELLNGYLAEMTRVVYQHRGTVDKYIGDAVMAVFGAPFPADDDPVRAARCALEMQEAFAVLMQTRPESERLLLRVGINTGPVVAGTVGSPLRLEYTCLGDTVNVAQRLEGIAPPGGIVVGARTADAIRSTMLVAARGAVTLKGKSDAVEIFHLLPTTAPPSTAS